MRRALSVAGGARRAALLAAALLAALALACGGGDEGGEDGAAPEAAPPPDAAELIAAAADRMAGVERFHFVLDHTRGATEIVRGIEMRRAEGDIDGPDRLRARVEGGLGPIDIDLGIVVLPDESWIENPLTGRWERIEIAIDALFDAREGVAALMRLVRDPAVEGRARVDGVETWRVSATADTDGLAIFPNAAPGREVRATAWIGAADPLVHRIEVRGPIADGEDRDIVRRLDLGRFGEAVDIVPPR